MKKSLLVVTTALALMAGNAMAQLSSSSSTTTQTTAMPAAPTSVTVDKTRQVTSDRNGTTVETEEHGSSTTVAPVAPMGVTELHKQTETTTVR